MDIVRSATNAVKDVPENLLPVGSGIAGMVGAATINIGKYFTSFSSRGQLYADSTIKFIAGGALFTLRSPAMRFLGFGLMAGSLIRLLVHWAILKPEQIPR